MSAYDIVRATPEHAIAIAQNLRLDDRRELWAASASQPTRTIMRSIKASTWANVGLVDGVPACVFGVVQVGLFGPAAVPWAMTTPLVDRHRRAFMRHSRQWVDKMTADHALLFNYVDARYSAAIRWLRWLGFDIMSPEPYGPFGLPFHRFEMNNV